MQELATIGKVKMNFRHYSGLDMYSDGPVENELLNIVRMHRPEEYASIIEEKASWPILYHLSERRANIIEWIPMNHTEKVLEVGSGCGAITGMLSRKAMEVTCCDLSRRRSEINAVRNAECENVTIHVGNFRDIEPDLPRDYDYIFLIGVFEYGQGYIGSDNPYEAFLLMLKKHLKPGGRIVIAIENKTGLKYFAGCAEDHLGKYFAGIEGYGRDSVARTFTRNGLVRIFRKCGMKDFHFYYPYPDYKFMVALHSDRYLPQYGELMDNVPSFDKDRLILFNEKHAYEDLIQDGMYPEFANSYEVIIGPALEMMYCRYSNDRDESFRIRTDICLDYSGRKIIRKIPLTEAARDHVLGMRDAYEALKERFKGGDLEINDCRVDEITGNAVFSYVNGIPLTALFDTCVANDDMESFNALFREYVRRISYRSEYPVTDYDLTFSNILVNGPIWTIIDYEWTYGKSIPPADLAFRALYDYMEGDRKRKKLNVKELYGRIGLSATDVERLMGEEAAFQKYVTGGRASMVELCKLIGKHTIVPAELEKEGESARRPDELQLYFDEGRGYNEDDSVFPEETYDEHMTATLDITCGSGVRNVRLDPAFSQCIVTFKNVQWNGVSLADETTYINIHPNGRWISDDSMIFDTDDPWIEFGLGDERVKRLSEDHLKITLMTTIIPKETAVALARSLAETETSSDGVPEVTEGIVDKVRRRLNSMGKK